MDSKFMEDFEDKTRKIYRQTLKHYLLNHRDVLSENFSKDKLLHFVYTSRRQEGIKFTTGFSQKLKRDRRVNDAFCLLDFERRDVSLKASYNISGKLVLKGSTNVEKWIPHTQLIGRAKTSPSVNQACVGVLYTLNRFNTKLRYTFTTEADRSSNHVNFVTNGIISSNGNGELGAGNKVSYKMGDTGPNKLLTYLWFKREYDSIVVKHKNPVYSFGLGSVSVHLFKKISDQLRIAAQLKHNFNIPNKKKIVFGLKYRQSEKFTVNAKINDQLKLQASFLMRLSDLVKLTISTYYRLDVVETSLSGLPFSINVSFNDTAESSL